MNSEAQNHDRTLATLIHLSVFSQFIVPFGNFIFPIILWSVKKKDAFIDQHGRSALNFQISLFLYACFVVTIGFIGFLVLGINAGNPGAFHISDESFQFNEFSEALPFIVWGGILGFIFLALFILDLFGVITASMKAGNGEYYKYPLSINFLGEGNISEKASTEQTV